MYVCFVIYKLELEFLEIIDSERNGVKVMLGIHVWSLGGKADNNIENGGNKKKVEIWERGELVFKNFKINL